MADVTCQVDIVLGTSTITVRDCLALRKHSILRLSRQAGTDLDIVVNGIPVLRCGVAVVDESTSVRVTDVLPPPGVEAA